MQGQLPAAAAVAEVSTAAAAATVVTAIEAAHGNVVLVAPVVPLAQPAPGLHSSHLVCPGTVILWQYGSAHLGALPTAAPLLCLGVGLNIPNSGTLMILAH